MILQKDRTVCLGHSPGITGRRATMTEARNSNPSGVREINRVSNSLLRIIAIFAIILSGSIFSVTKAQDSLLVYESITPSSGTNISSFNFVLTFDFSKVIEEYGAGEYGVGYYGYYNKKKPEQTQGFEIYEGDKETGTFISRYTSSVNGASSDFKVGNTITVSFPDVFPEPGKEYTVYISNDFKVFLKGETAPIGGINGILSFLSEPIVLKYSGESASVEKLAIEKTSIKSGTELDVLNDVTFTFNQPLAVGTGVCMLSNETVNVESTSYKIDGNNITFHFNNEKLLTRTEYNILLPEGSVVALSNSEIKNQETSIRLTGTYLNYVDIISYTPTQPIITNKFSCNFALPDNVIIGTLDGIFVDLKASIYQGEITDENLVATVQGSTSSDGKSLIWEFLSFSPKPSCTYTVFVPKGQFYFINKETGNFDYTYKNNQISFSYTSPSIEDMKLPSLEFRAPVNGKYEGTGTELLPNSKVEYLGTLQLGLKDYKYSYDGNSYDPSYMNNATVYLYDITYGTETLVAERPITTRAIEPEDWHIPNYTVWNAGINTYLLSGHKYKVVIPAGKITVDYKLIRYYVSPEWSIELEGDTPTEVVLENCSLPENSELSELSSVKWTFKGGFSLDTGKSVMLRYIYTSSIGQGGLTDGCTTTIANYGSRTVVTAYLPAGADGMGYQFNTKNDKYEIIFPEGLIYYEGDPNIKNSEMVYTIIPVAKTPEVVKPEYVNLSVEVSEMATIEQKAVKGEPTTITLTPTEDWKVESLIFNGKDVTNYVVGGTYTTDELTEDSAITANLAYNGPLAQEDKTTGVWTVPDSQIRIYRDGDHIVVDGITPENVINVYSVSGIHITTTRVSDGNDTMLLTLAAGQTYVVTVDGVAAKIRM